MPGATYKGRSQAIHVGGSEIANAQLSGHGWRVTVPGTQVVGNGASATVTFASDSIADTDGYWEPNNPTKVKIPPNLGGVYVFGADGFVPGYVSGLLFEVVFDTGDEAESLVQTSPPKSLNAMAGFYRVNAGDVFHLKITNQTGGSITLSKGSFTGVIMLPGVQTVTTGVCANNRGSTAGVHDFHSGPGTFALVIDTFEASARIFWSGILAVDNQFVTVTYDLWITHSEPPSTFGMVLAQPGRSDEPIFIQSGFGGGLFHYAGTWNQNTEGPGSTQGCVTLEMFSDCGSQGCATMSVSGTYTVSGVGLSADPTSQ